MSLLAAYLLRDKTNFLTNIATKISCSVNLDKAFFNAS